MDISYRVHFLRGRQGSVEGANFIVGRWALLGRDPDADIRIPDNTVSRVHAAIAWADGSGFVLGDLGSRNGVHVNGRRIRCCTVKSGDRIRLGNAVFELRPAAEFKKVVKAA